MYPHFEEDDMSLERDPMFPDRYISGRPAPKREPAPSLIYQCGDSTYTKQFAQRPFDGQWFYRVTDERGHFGRWLECSGKPDYAWYNPQAGHAYLPTV